MTQTPAPAARPTQGGARPTVPTPPAAPAPPEAPSGTTAPPGYVVNPEIPEGAIVISIAFFVTVAFVLVFFPLARAFARRMDRSATAPPAVPREVTERLAHIENAVDSIALEVERISEGQRFATKLLSEKQSDGSRVAGTT
jgi:hypothetical protein